MGDPSTNFCESGVVWLKLGVFHPSTVHGGHGRVVGPYPLSESVSGSPVCWGDWSILSPNILGLVQYGAVRCGVLSDRPIIG